MSPANHFSNPWLRWQEFAVEETWNNVQRMRLLPSLVQRARSVRKGVTASEVVYEEDRLKVLHYQSRTPPRHRTPLLLVYALVNRPYILDLKEGRSVVANFVERGFDTYLLDWGVPTDADRYLTLDDYINGYLVNVTDYLCERTGIEQVSVLGYCMGGTMSAMFTALHPRLVKNLILLAAPIDFATRDGLLNIWTQSANFDVDKFVDAFGNCPPEFLQASFLLLRPVQNLIQKPMDFYEHMHEEKYLEDFLATETWLQDNIAVPGETYREFVKYLYQQNLLTQGRMTVGKHIVALKNITCPVLNLIAGNDDLVPCAQSVAFTDCVGSADRKTIQLQGCGHIGLAISGRAQKELWPQACDWLSQRDAASSREV
ncbi:MAG TPA: class III poly(R)-hydroxyalkanoic acid synthase subunit PhaC [Candidatus Acidoferrales bacterium]|nr:class III poly(R)-hydroxyalkanoic acid synthase subunit PhaC [Candidatus Acidoferrales bacterium]